MPEPTFISVLINQVPHQLPANASLADAVHQFGISPPFAAAVNLKFVPKNQYASFTLSPNDEIELIAPITGG
jgi:sulfur carrier protein